MNPTAATIPYGPCAVAGKTEPVDLSGEWLEADGLGGFSCGTTGFERTRRYHALLLSSARPPGERFLLVAGAEVWVNTRAGRFALSSHRYAPDIVHPDGVGRIASFRHSPWPTWEFLCEDGTRVRQEILALHGTPRVMLSWSRLAGEGECRLEVRPLFAGRDYHSLHHENDAIRFIPDRVASDGSRAGHTLRWSLYDGVPAFTAWSTGQYTHDPLWFRRGLLKDERARGFDHTEDLASPGTFVFDGAAGESCLIFTSETPAGAPHSHPEPTTSAATIASGVRATELERRSRLGGPLERAADQYIVRRGPGRTIIAGYPWFADWGRDTFIALRGLCLATGRLDDARDILVEWTGAVSRGMLPNRFPDAGDEPEYNSVDASLWFVVCASEFLDAAATSRFAVADSDRARLEGSIREIIAGYAAGTRHGIRMDSDGLLASGEPGVQLTWMDARVGSKVITPRIGKPVEVQALWIHALTVAARLDSRWNEALDLARGAFEARFWNPGRGCLFDTVDVDHVAGATDASMRPNQIFAVGGLPIVLLSPARARAVVDAVERELLTPIGLRSLEPGDPAFAPRYGGGPEERDAVYHQGTVWPWLIGPFVEAWVRVRGGTAAAKNEARSRFVAPLLAHMGRAGLGHVSEVADGVAPHKPNGCPFQAWSLGELIRLDRVVLRDRC